MPSFYGYLHIQVNVRSSIFTSEIYFYSFRVILPTSLFVCCAIGCVIKRKKQIKRMIHAEPLFYIRGRLTQENLQNNGLATRTPVGMIDPRLITISRNDPHLITRRMPPPYTEQEEGNRNNFTGEREAEVDRSDPPPSYSSIFS